MLVAPGTGSQYTGICTADPTARSGAGQPSHDPSGIPKTPRDPWGPPRTPRDLRPATALPPPAGERSCGRTGGRQENA